MSTTPTADIVKFLASIQTQLADGDFAGIVDLTASATTEQITDVLTRLPMKQCAIVFRLLPNERATSVFERLAPKMQSDVIRGLQDSDLTRAMFGRLGSHSVFDR